MHRKLYFVILPEPDICSSVALVWLLHLVKLEIEGGVLGQLSGPGQLLDEGEELVVVAAIVVELDLADELNLDALMFQAICFAVKGHVHLKD